MNCRGIPILCSCHGCGLRITEARPGVRLNDKVTEELALMVHSGRVVGS